MKKPHWFRLIDFASIAGLGILSGGVTVYAMSVGVEGPRAREGVVLCWVVTALFFAIWAWFCRARKKWLDEFTWYPAFGIMMHPGDGYVLPSQEECDRVVRLTVDRWSAHFPKAEEVVKEEVVWCWFRKDLDETARNPARQRVNGLTVAGTHKIMVDYDSDDQALETTAFEHELGHVIMGNATGKWDQTEHHEFAKKNGLK